MSGVINRATARRVAHAWVSAAIKDALQNGRDGTLGTDNFADYWMVRAEVEAISTRHGRLADGYAVNLAAAGHAPDANAVRDLHQAMERLRLARVGRAMSYREIGRRIGKCYTVVYNAFHVRPPAWETFAAIVGVLGADPVHFRPLWRKAHDAWHPDRNDEKSDGARQVKSSH